MRRSPARTSAPPSEQALFHEQAAGRIVVGAEGRPVNEAERPVEPYRRRQLGPRLQPQDAEAHVRRRPLQPVHQRPTNAVAAGAGVDYVASHSTVSSEELCTYTYQGDATMSIVYNSDTGAVTVNN